MRMALFCDIHLPLGRCPLGLLRSKRLLGWFNWRVRRGRLHRPELLARVVADLKRSPPELILVGGDLTNLALPEEFQRAALWLAELAEPERLVLVPGNHDAYVPGAFEEGARMWARWLGGFLRHDRFPYVVERGRITVVAASTAEPSPPGYATGRLGARQLARIEEELVRARARGSWRVLLLHHPPHAAVAPRKRLIDREQLCRVLRRAGAELVLFGHLHRFERVELQGPAGTIPGFMAPSASLRDPRPGRRAGYLLFDLDPDRGRLAWRLRGFDPSFTRIEDLARGEERLVAEAPAAAEAEGER